MIEITKEMLENLVEEGFYGKDGVLKNQDYTIDEMYLVRTTDIFPTDKKVKSISFDNGTLKADSFIFDNILSDFSKDIKNNCQVAYNGYRSTIHFCLNGLVGNHAYGNFSNKKFIILEPFKYHVNEGNIISLRSEDTFFKDYVNLYEATIIMSKDIYEKLKIENPDELSNYNIITYDFTKEQIKEMYPVPEGFRNEYSQMRFEKDIVRCAMQMLGAPCFSISSHGYSDDLKSQPMNGLITKIRQEYNIAFNPHFASPIHLQDSYQNQKNSMASDINHFIYVVTNSGLEQSFIDELLCFVPFFQNENNFNDMYFFSSLRHNKQVISRDLLYSKISEFISKIGIDKFIELTKEYNENFDNTKKITR